MLAKGPAKKVTIYVNEDSRYHHQPLYEAILGFLMHKGVAGATASRAMAGFGAGRVLHTPKIEVLAEHLPVRIEFIEAAAKIDELLPALHDMVDDGLIEVQDTTVVRAARKGRQEEPALPHEARRQAAKMMRVFLGESDRLGDEPLYDAIVKKLRMLDIAGATVYRGIYGYGAKGHTHKQSFWHLSKDLPVMISVIDTPEKIAEAAAAVESMLGDGLIVLSDAEMIRLVRSHAASNPS